MTTDFEPSRVLCALDLREPIDGILETATSIAARFDAQLYLLHVWNPWSSVAPDGSLVPLGDDLDAMSRGLASELDVATRIARRQHARVEGSLVPGTPWEQIVLFAETNACDLIVAGTHGRTGIARLFSGSVAERVVRESSVPVLVVPAGKQAARIATVSSVLPDRRAPQPWSDRADRRP